MAVVVLDHEERPAGSEQSAYLGDSRLAVGVHEIGETGVDNVDAVVEQRYRFRRSEQHTGVAQPLVDDPPHRPQPQAGMGLDADHMPGRLGEAWQVVAGAAAEVEHDALGPGRDRPHGRLE